MSTIAAIPTTYAGVEFRSRLEARWAVFFDALGLRWEYEPEGYELASGKYLPDFWLPSLNIFAEIKPEDVDDPRHEELSVMTGKRLALLVGAPSERTGDLQYQIHIPFYDEDGTLTNTWKDNLHDFCVCRTCNAIGFQFGAKEDRICGSAHPRTGSDRARMPVLDAVQMSRGYQFWEAPTPRKVR